MKDFLTDEEVIELLNKPGTKIVDSFRGEITTVDGLSQISEFVLVHTDEHTKKEYKDTYERIVNGFMLKGDK